MTPAKLQGRSGWAADHLRLLAIADSGVLAGRGLAAAAAEAVAGGATAIQLRMKREPAATVYRVAVDLVRLLAVPVYVNDRVDVAQAADAFGVHLGADDLPAAAVRASGFGPLAIGVSVGSAAEADAVLDARPDYWSVGSVFQTGSKPDAGKPIGVNGWRALARRAPAGMPVVGIGGVDASNAGELIRAGAAGIAVISAIFAAADVRQAARRLRDAVDAAGH
jgi:thiamine-phosphate diphosphorylase